MNSHQIVLACSLIACCLLGCASSGGGGAGGEVPESGEPGDAAGNQNAPDELAGEEPSEFAVRSAAFADQQPIPQRYTADGDDVSPPLVFQSVPASAVELALTVVDPDAPAGDFVHWVIYKLPATTTALPEALPTDEMLDDPPGAVQGENGFGDIGYGGPAPPAGETHRYVFTLYALSEPLDLAPGADQKTLLEAIDPLIVTQTQVTGTYSR